MVRSAARRRSALSLPKGISIGFRSGEYLGRNRSVAPRAAIRRHARVAWVAAATESGNLALYDLLIERFSASAEAADARGIVAKLRPAQFAEPATISAF